MYILICLGHLRAPVGPTFSTNPSRFRRLHGQFHQGRIAITFRFFTLTDRPANGSTLKSDSKGLTWKRCQRLDFCVNQQVTSCWMIGWLDDNVMLSKETHLPHIDSLMCINTWGNNKNSYVFISPIQMPYSTLKLWPIKLATKKTTGDSSHQGIDGLQYQTSGGLKSIALHPM